MEHLEENVRAHIEQQARLSALVAPDFKKLEQEQFTVGVEQPKLQFTVPLSPVIKVVNKWRNWIRNKS